MADGTRTRDHRDHNPGLYQLSYRHRAQRQDTAGASAALSRAEHGLRLRRPRDAATGRVEDVGLDDDRRLADVERPRTARTSPVRTAPRKFVFDSIVTVRAPGGRLRNAHTAPAVSASAMSTPP